jgi:uncharacterized membrane protein YjjB (DUF3815 family)
MKGWRKWSIAMVALSMGFSLALLGLLTADFATIASICVGAFAAGNAMEHYSGHQKYPESER